MSFSFGANPGAAAGASSGFGGFGSTSTAAPAATGGGFNFGATPAPAASTGSSFNFGATPAATSAAPAGSFSFGSTPAAGSAVPATGGGFGFGSTPGGAAGGTSSFGGGFQAAGQTTKPPLFGQKTGTTPGFGFGSTTGATMGSSFGGFGNTSGSTGFGTTGSTGFGGGFGASTPSAFGTSAAGGSTFGSAPVPVNAPAPIICGADASVAQLNSVKYAYQDPAQSRFKFLLYNTVDPTQRHLYTRPAHISERLWNQAELDNPDPLNCAPAPVIGFKDLMKRIQVQQEYAGKYNTYTNDLRGQLKEMEKTTRATEEKLEKCRHEHVQLFHSLVKVMKDIEFLQNAGKPLQREEMQLAMALKKLQTLLDSPAQYKARLNDAVSLERIQDAAPVPPANQLSPEDLQRVFQFLDKQRQGLEHLTNILNEDLAAIKFIKESWRR